MSFLLTILSNLGALVSKLAPLFLVYRAGKKDAEHDFNKTIQDVLEEENAELLASSVLPDAAIADKLRDRAKAKRKDQD